MSHSPSMIYYISTFYYFFFHIYSVYGHFVCMHPCTHVHGLVPSDQTEEGIRSLELGLEIVVSYQDGAGTKPRAP